MILTSRNDHLVCEIGIKYKSGYFYDYLVCLTIVVK
jgi:hypothetical protein